MILILHDSGTLQGVKEMGHVGFRHENFPWAGQWLQGEVSAVLKETEAGFRILLSCGSALHLSILRILVAAESHSFAGWVVLIHAFQTR